MAYVNGRLPASALSPIYMGRLRHDAAAAWNALNAESVSRFGVRLQPMGSMSSYRTYAQQVYLWNNVPHARDPNWVARPGTSNHGWGLAVDLRTPQMRAIIDRIGEKYGWAKKWSDAPAEWWHIRFRPGVWKGKVHDPVIRKGSKDRGAIIRLQKLLRALNYTKVVNGKYGIWTRRAVYKFQKRWGLPADRVVGPATWAKLRERVRAVNK